jgi:hypothetical protein
MAVDGRFSRKKVLIGRNSRGTPCSSANEIKRRAAKACTKNKKRQFHTGNLERQNKEIRRASEQTSPQVACVVGHPAMGRGGGLSSGSLLNPPFPFPEPE